MILVKMRDRKVNIEQIIWVKWLVRIPGEEVLSIQLQDGNITVLGEEAIILDMYLENYTYYPIKEPVICEF